MFMRYLGGGIGHLEQFPPANNDEDMAVPEDNDEDTEEIDNAGNTLGSPERVGPIGEMGDDGGHGRGEGEDDGDDDGGGDDDSDDDNGEDDDEDMEEDGDPEEEECLDEETGNVY